MTAPDVNADVRARFEAKFGGTWPMAKASDGEYLDSFTTCLFEGYRAAHADLPEEVRELVEALQAARDYGAMTGAEWVIDMVDAALAKFTHQEKEHGS